MRLALSLICALSLLGASCTEPPSNQAGSTGGADDGGSSGSGGQSPGGAAAGGNAGSAGSGNAGSGGAAGGGAAASGGSAGSSGTSGMRPAGIDPEHPASIPGDPAPNADTDEEQLLRKALWFYGAQRCGDGANWLLESNPSGDSCHLQDGEDYAAGTDMTGGWHDAGDFIKFSLTNAWASYVLLKTYEVYPDAFDDAYGEYHEETPNGVPDLLDQVKYAEDYLVKIHPAPDVLVARVGGDQDHGPFVTSPTQSHWSVEDGGGARPVDPNDSAGADVAGLAAASLALMARFYAPYDAQRAATYLAHARRIYSYAEDNLRTTRDNFYEDDTYADSMLCGAVELYRATGETPYFEQAQMWNAEAGRHYWVVDWSTTSDYCRHSLVLSGSSQALATWTKDVDSYLGMVSDTPGVRGLAYFAEWGSLRYATGAAFSAALLYDVTGNERYLDFAQGQLHYVKGSNEYGRSFVVGYGNNPPVAPHHRNAYGRDSFDADLAHRFELTGALVGGPTPDGYEDSIFDYVSNEVTIDYNTGLVGLAAASVATQRR